MSFDGRSVLVTGGSRGIGQTTALRFAELGAQQGRDRLPAQRPRRRGDGGGAASRGRRAAARCAATSSSERVVQEAAELGPFDVVVHNAATGVIGPALETEDKHWDWTLNANARALLSLARALAPSMRAGSSFVAISSLGSLRVLENYVLVGVSKAALESVVRYLAVELAPRGIRVNAVSGGVVETGALDHFPNREQMISESRERTPAGRLVEPRDIADAVCFLCSRTAPRWCAARR